MVNEPLPTYHWKNEWDTDDEGESEGPFWVDDRGERSYPLGDPDKFWVTYDAAYDYARAHGGRLVVH